MPLKPELVRRLLRFAVVGLVVMGFFAALNWLFARWFSVPVALALSYPPAWALHYSLNKWWTFGCERTDTARQVSEYLVMLVITTAVQTFFFWVAYDLCGMPNWVAAVVGNGSQIVLSFLLMQRRVFAGQRSSA